MSAEPVEKAEQDPRAAPLYIAAIRWKQGVTTGEQFVADCLNAGYSMAEAQAALAILEDPFEGEEQ